MRLFVFILLVCAACTNTPIQQAPQIPHDTTIVQTDELPQGWKRFIALEPGGSSIKAYLVECDGTNYEVKERVEKDAWAEEATAFQMLNKLLQNVNSVSSLYPDATAFIACSNGFMNVLESQHGLDSMDVKNFLAKTGFNTDRLYFVTHLDEAMHESIAQGKRRGEISIGSGGGSSQMYENPSSYCSCKVGANYSTGFTGDKTLAMTKSCLARTRPSNFDKAVCTGGVNFEIIKKYTAIKGVDINSSLDAQDVLKYASSWFSTEEGFNSAFPPSYREEEKLPSRIGMYASYIWLRESIKYHGIKTIRLGRHQTWVGSFSKQVFLDQGF